MSLDFLPFSRPSIGEDEIAAVEQVLRSGWITTGPKNQELEQRFAERLGCRHAVALSSATGALHVTLLALGIGPGDEVITPSLTWVSTANVITLLGATPVFVDVDRDTLMCSAQAVEAAIGPRTRAIVPVHYAGSTLDLEGLRTVAGRHGIALVEDAAHAVGSEYRGRPVGSRGTAIFSFHAIKNLTCAEGAMFVSDDSALAERVRRLKFHGLGVDAYDRLSHGRKPQAEVIEPGFKYNLADLNAALALVQLKRLDALNARRQALAERYLERLAGLPLAPLGLPAHEQRHAWHLFILRIDAEACGLGRDAFMEALKARGIGSGIHFIASHLHHYYRQRQPRLSLPNSEWNSARLCSIPLFPTCATTTSSASPAPSRRSWRNVDEALSDRPGLGGDPGLQRGSQPAELLRRTEAACLELGRAFEIVLVDDGSRDRSAELLQAAAERDGSAVVAVILNRNYGQHAAILAGFEQSRGDLVITLDADLQNPPEEIPRLVERAAQGYDVVGSHPRRAPGLGLAALAFAPGESGGAALHRGRHARLRLHAARLPAQHRRSDAGLPRTQYLHPDPGQRLRPAYLRDPRRPRRARPRRIEIQRDAPAQPDVRPGHLHDHHAAAPAQPGRRRHGPGRLPLRPVPPRAAPGLRRRLGRQRPVRAVRRAVHVQRRAVARHGPARRVPRRMYSDVRARPRFFIERVVRATPSALPSALQRAGFTSSSSEPSTP